LKIPDQIFSKFVILFLMRVLLPVFAVIIFGLFILSFPSVKALAQTPTFQNQLQPAAAAACDFWCSLVNALTGGSTGQNIPAALEDLTRARTPFQMGANSSGAEVIPSGTIVGENNQTKVLGTDTDVVRETSYQYGLHNSMQTNTAAPASSNDFFTQLGIALSNLLGIRNEGNEQATEYAAGNLPAGVAESKLAEFNNSMNNQIALGENSDSQVLGLFSDYSPDAMPNALFLKQCGSLPYPCGLPQGPTVMPYPSPTFTPTPTPTINPNATPEPPIPNEPSPTIPGGVLANCTGTTDYCSVQCLRQFFPTDESARLAGIICRRESQGNTFALNDRCRADRFTDPARRSRDFSAGLFQINLLVPGRCDIATHTTIQPIIDNWNTPAQSCSSNDFDSPSTSLFPYLISNSPLDQCVRYYWNFTNMISYAVQLSQNGTNWCPWRTGPVIGDCSIYIH
jgi:hypothetical protein